MKLELLLIAFMFIINCTRSQVLNDSLILKRQDLTDKITKNYNTNYNQYMKYRNRYNSIGWFNLCAGLTMSCVGGLATLITSIEQLGNQGESEGPPVRGKNLLILGTAISFSSMPLFMIAHNYKQKAKLELKVQSIKNNFKNSNFTAYTLQLNF